jgi:hypothetical protein
MSRSGSRTFHSEMEEIQSRQAAARHRAQSATDKQQKQNKTPGPSISKGKLKDVHTLEEPLKTDPNARTDLAEVQVQVQVRPTRVSPASVC